jgi:hypothetical protein
MSRSSRRWHLRAPHVGRPHAHQSRHHAACRHSLLSCAMTDDAVGARACGLAPAPRADPVGRLVSGQHVADATDAAIFTAPHGEPLQREGRPGTVSQQVLETLKICRCTW